MTFSASDAYRKMADDLSVWSGRLLIMAVPAAPDPDMRYYGTSRPMAEASSLVADEARAQE